MSPSRTSPSSSPPPASTKSRLRGKSIVIEKKRRRYIYKRPAPLKDKVLRDLEANSQLGPHSTVEQILTEAVRLRDAHGPAGTVQAVLYQYLRTIKVPDHVIDKYKDEQATISNRETRLRALENKKRKADEMEDGSASRPSSGRLALTSAAHKKRIEQQSIRRNIQSRERLQRFIDEHERVVGLDFDNIKPAKFIVKAKPIRNQYMRKSYGKKFSNMLDALDVNPAWKQRYKTLRMRHVDRRHTAKKEGWPPYDSGVEDSADITGASDDERYSGRKRRRLLGSSQQKSARFQAANLASSSTPQASIGQAHPQAPGPLFFTARKKRTIRQVVEPSPPSSPGSEDSVDKPI